MVSQSRPSQDSETTANAQGRQSLHQAIVENLRDPVWVTDLQLQILWANPAAQELSGHSLDELRQLSWRNIVAPSSQPQVTQAIADYLTPEKLSEAADTLAPALELELLTVDGTPRWHECKVSLMRDSQGSPQTLLIAARDIARCIGTQLLADNARDLIYRYRLAPSPGFE
ncbi:MAG: PAS domain-containing protein, partial [Thermoleophilia bacterium]|nr:PAS domain-containing protein [Thermoleophilia bacterium]